MYWFLPAMAIVVTERSQTPPSSTSMPDNLTRATEVERLTPAAARVLDCFPSAPTMRRHRSVRVSPSISYVANGCGPPSIVQRRMPRTTVALLCRGQGKCLT